MAKTMKPPPAYLAIRLRGEVRKKVEELARQEECSLGQICRWAIREYLERHNQWQTNLKTQGPGTAT